LQMRNVLFPDPQIQTRSKTSKKKNRLVAQCCLLFKIKNLLDVHDFFDQSTLELVKFMFLSVECTTGFANYAKTTTYFLVVKGNCSLSVRKLFCSYASFHITRPFDLRSPRKVSDPFIKIQQLMEMCLKNDPTLEPPLFNCGFACASTAYLVNFSCASI